MVWICTEDSYRTFLSCKYWTKLTGSLLYCRLELLAVLTCLTFPLLSTLLFLVLRLNRYCRCFLCSWPVAPPIWNLDNGRFDSSPILDTWTCKGLRNNRTLSNRSYIWWDTFDKVTLCAKIDKAREYFRWTRRRNARNLSGTKSTAINHPTTRRKKENDLFRSVWICATNAWARDRASTWRAPRQYWTLCRQTANRCCAQHPSTTYRGFQGTDLFSTLGRSCNPLRPQGWAICP